MVLVYKIKKKIAEQGVRGLLSSVLRLAQRHFSRMRFKIKASLLFIDYNRFKKENLFLNLDIDNLFLDSLPTHEMLNKIKANRYLILSDNYIDFSQRTKDGFLIWNKDMVNNIEWPMNKWGVDIVIQTDQGDIKRPWELGRLHQLVQLGLIYRSLKSKTEQEKVSQLAGKIIVDFRVSNPHFKGPQWMCAMDVGIRIANICLAADLLGQEFIQKHSDDLTFEILRHEFFILNNLENKAGHVVNNHFLGNLVGLIFCACHQTFTAASIEKIKKLYDQLLTELDQQFFTDGGNFENSTYYHRLSGELILFGLSLCQQRLLEHSCDIEISKKLKFKLKSILDFSRSITDYEGYVPQIGDNDSGHLFIFDSLQYERDDLNHRGFILGLNIFIDEQNSKDIFSKVINSSINVKFKAENQGFMDLSRKAESFGSQDVFLKTQKELSNKRNVQLYEFKIDPISLDNRNISLFPEFGLYLYKSADFYFAIRSGYSATDFIGGHRHVDQLSISIKSKDVCTSRDPGSFVYTANSELRNVLRSAPVHNIPILHGDGILKNKDIFKLRDFKGGCLYFGIEGFVGYYDGYLDRYYRLIKFNENNIIVNDWSHKDLPILRLDFNEKVFSQHYGKIQYD